MNNKKITIVSGLFLVILVLISTLTTAFNNDQIKLLLVMAFFANAITLISAIGRWIKHGEITTFTKSDEDF